MTNILKNIAISFAMLVSTLATPLHAFEVSGESFPAEFTLTSWTSNNGSSMTAEGIVGEGYGKVSNYDFVSSSAAKIRATSPAERAQSITTASWSQELCKAFGNATARRSPCTP